MKTTHYGIWTKRRIKHISLISMWIIATIIEVLYLQNDYQFMSKLTYCQPNCFPHVGTFLLSVIIYLFPVLFTLAYSDSVYQLERRIDRWYKSLPENGDSG